jgi:hypothetical protein
MFNAYAYYFGSISLYRHGVNISTLIESSKRSESSVMADLEERTFAFVKFLVSADSEIYTPEGSNLDIEALDLEHPVLDAGMNTGTASDLDLRTNVSDVKSGLNAKSANEGVRGPLGIAASSGKAMIVAGGLGLRGTEEDGGGDDAVVARGLSENLSAKGGDEDGSVGGRALPDLEMDSRSWEVGPACRVGFPTG